MAAPLTYSDVWPLLALRPILVDSLARIPISTGEHRTKLCLLQIESKSHCTITVEVESVLNPFDHCGLHRPKFPIRVGLDRSTVNAAANRQRFPKRDQLR